MPAGDTGPGDSTHATPGAVISFATSRPAAALFPMEEFREAASQVLTSDRLAAILQLGSPYGYEPLRAWLRDRAIEEGVARETDDIVITNGCQQALDLLERVLVTAGDTVAIEDPVYPGLRQVLARAGARAVGVPVDGSGVDADALAAVLDHDRPKLLVLTPSFQNPTGGTMPLAAREAVVRLARVRNVIVIESDIYGKLRYEGEPLPTLKQMDPTGDVIQLGSFSKIAFPGLRVGWVIAPRPLASAIAQAKQWSDLHSNQLAQAILLRFAESGMLEAHRRRMIAAGTERLHAVLDACRQHLPPGSHTTRPEGGMNLWVRLPEPLDAADLLPRARQEGVAYLPGSYFGVSRIERGGLRLSFAGLPPEEIYRGIEALGKVAAAELRRGGSQEVSEPSIALV
jgi:2-aminoadipate transaminase